MLRRAEWLLVQLEMFLAKVSLVLVFALTLGQILARNLLQAGIPAADSLSRLLLLYVVFTGAALATAADRHIKVDVIAHWLSARWRSRLVRPFNFVGMCICVLFTVAATHFWLDEWEYAAGHERWLVILNLILPVGFGLLALHFLLGWIQEPGLENGRE